MATARHKADLHFQGCPKAHLEVPLLVLDKHLLEGLLEEGGVEGVAHDHVATRHVGQEAHLIETSLVQCTRKDVHNMAVVGHPLGQGLIELHGGGGADTAQRDREARLTCQLRTHIVSYLHCLPGVLGVILLQIQV